MGKKIFLPVLALAGGGVGLLLRQWQWMAAFDPGTELFRSGHPSGIALLCVVAVLTILFLILSPGAGRLRRRERRIGRRAAGLSSFYMIMMVSAAVLFLAFAVLDAMEVMKKLTLWRADARHNPLPLMEGLSVVLALPAAVSLLILGQSNYRGVTFNGYRQIVTLPAFAALPWLVSVYQENSKSPQLTGFVWELLAVMLLLIALFQNAAFANGKGRRAALVFFSLMGVAFGMISLGDGLSVAGRLRQCAAMMTVLANLIAAMSPSRTMPDESSVPRREETIRYSEFTGDE